MIPPIKAIKRVLWGNIILDGVKVPVIKRSYPYDKTPCVTIDDSGGSAFINRHILNVPYPVSNEHPQYDERNPFKKIPQQVIREYYETTLNINVWANTEDERENLNNIILKLFYEAQSDNYKFCNNYHDGDCAYMDNTCYGKHFDGFSHRTAKHQCPNPLVYGYENIFTTYNLIRASFHIDQPFTLDDRSKDDVVLRSVLKLHTGYYVDHIIGGVVDEDIDYCIVKEDLI